MSKDKECNCVWKYLAYDKKDTVCKWCGGYIFRLKVNK